MRGACTAPSGSPLEGHSGRRKKRCHLRDHPDFSRACGGSGACRAPRYGRRRKGLEAPGRRVHLEHRRASWVRLLGYPVTIRLYAGGVDGQAQLQIAGTSFGFGPLNSSTRRKEVEQFRDQLVSVSCITGRPSSGTASVELAAPSLQSLQLPYGAGETQPPSEPASDAGPAVQALAWVCPRCAAPAYPGSSRCGNCGYGTEQFGDGMVPVRIKSAPSKLPVVLILCAAVAIGTAGGVVMSVAKGTPEPTPLPSAARAVHIPLQPNWQRVDMNQATIDSTVKALGSANPQMAQMLQSVSGSYLKNLVFYAIDYQGLNPIGTINVQAIPGGDPATIDSLQPTLEGELEQMGGTNIVFSHQVVLGGNALVVDFNLPFTDTFSAVGRAFVIPAGAVAYDLTVECFTSDSSQCLADGNTMANAMTVGP